MKKKKKLEREAPNEEWFWKNRHEVWKIHPDMTINNPYKSKEKKSGKGKTSKD